MASHLSALLRFFYQLVLRYVIVINPAASVQAAKHFVVEGKSPALSVEQVRLVCGGALCAPFLTYHTLILIMMFHPLLWVR
jgi:hypothetical protein